jgi:hypothetical protein
MVSWSTLVCTFPLLVATAYGHYAYYRLVPLVLLLTLRPLSTLFSTGVTSSMTRETKAATIAQMWALFVVSSGHVEAGLTADRHRPNGQPMSNYRIE